MYGAHDEGVTLVVCNQTSGDEEVQTKLEPLTVEPLNIHMSANAGKLIRPRSNAAITCFIVISCFQVRSKMMCRFAREAIRTRALSFHRASLRRVDSHIPPNNVTSAPPNRASTRAH